MRAVSIIANTRKQKDGAMNKTEDKRHEWVFCILPVLVVWGMAISSFTNHNQVLAQSKEQVSQSFVGDFDDAKALEVLYGTYQPNLKGVSRKVVILNGGVLVPLGEKNDEVAQPRPNRPSLYPAPIEGLFDAVTHVFLSADMKQSGQAQRLILCATNTPDNNCHACAPLVSGAIFRRVNDKWELEQEYPILDIHGSFGVPDNCSWVQVGKSKQALLVKHYYCSSGSMGFDFDLIDFDGRQPQRLLSIGRTFGENDPGYNADKIGNEDGSLVFKKSDKPFWNAVLKTTYENRLQHAAPSVFVYENGSYQQPGKIGIQLKTQDKEAEQRTPGGRKVIIDSVLPGTPADKSGLRLNDQILSVDGFPTDYRDNEEIANLIRGVPGTTVRLIISRHGAKRTIYCLRISSAKTKLAADDQSIL